ncbi:MAG TPA: FliA/WhiG family RNA polymerase sigma factor [Bryobacteraceae bacterium]|nr:FliA/WhiG family RNA polymerase sigma factor [Bryobacteraceae bacterium]
MISPYQQPKALDPAVREQMILDHLSQVRFIAARIHEKLPRHVPLDDLISAGILGLIAAVDNFDESRSIKLRTYAEHKIRGHILNSLSKLEGAPRQRSKRRAEVQQAIEAAERRLGSTPDSEEIAREMKVSLDEYHEILLEIQSVSLGSLEPVDADNTEGLFRYLADPHSDDPERLIQKARLQELLVQALSELPEMERMVLSLYYMEGMNLREIAAIVDLHMTRISQLKTQAVLRLRTRFGKLWPGRVEI